MPHLVIMQVHHFITLVLALLCLQAQGLKIACKTMVIERTPLAYAADNFYKDDATSVINGGIPDLSDNTVDLAGNAVTQGLKYYVRNRNYRLIGIIVEVTYRLVDIPVLRSVWADHVWGPEIWEGIWWTSCSMKTSILPEQTGESHSRGRIWRGSSIAVCTRRQCRHYFARYF
jgi:hypothetical protein